MLFLSNISVIYIQIEFILFFCFVGALKPEGGAVSHFKRLAN
jgi:hypothetical protein